MRESWCFVDRYSFQTYTCDKIGGRELKICEIDSVLGRKLGKEKKIEWLYVLGGGARCDRDALILL